MLNMLPFALNVLEQGLVYTPVVFAVFITSKVITFDDLTVEGSFSTGGAIAAHLLILGQHPFISLIAGMLAGGVAGCTTALLHTRLKLNNLVSGIIVTTGFYSINLKIASSFISLSSVSTFFQMYPFNSRLGTPLVLLFISGALFIILKWFLSTQVGFMIRALGDNPQMLTNLGQHVSTYKIIALSLSNGLVGLGGALFVHYTGFFAISGSIGTLVLALASLALGSLIAPGFKMSMIMGAILYQAIFAITISLQFDPTWNKLITALIMVLVMARRIR